MWLMTTSFWGRVNMGEVRDYIIAGLAVLVLLAFIWLFGRDLWATLSGRTRQSLSDQLEDPVLYVATAVAGLVGTVSAAFLGVEAGIVGEAKNSEIIRVAYVVVYILFGAASVVAWVNKKDKTPASLRNLASTFIGITLAAVGTYLGVEANLL
jgi:hypothetical protein